MSQVVGIRATNPHQKNLLLAQVSKEYPGCHVIMGDAHEEAYQEFANEAVAQLNRNPQVALVYADSLSIDVEGNESVVYRQPFDRNKIVNGNPVGGPFLINNAVLVQHGMDLFDTNLTAFAVWEMVLRVSQNRISYHIPKVLSKVIVQNPYPQLTYEQEINYIRQKLFSPQG